MNVCVVVYLFPARSETFVLEHVMGLACRGFKVTVVARSCDKGISPTELDAIGKAGVNVIYTGSLRVFSTKVGRVLHFLRATALVVGKPKFLRLFLEKSSWTVRDILLANEVVEFVATNDIDLVNVHFGDLAARIQFVSKVCKIFPPIIATWHGSDANAIPKQLEENVFDDLFASNVLHTVGSDFMRKRLIALGARAQSITKIPMGIDVERFSYSERTHEKGEAFNILSVGRLDEVKGHAYLIEACARLINRGYDVGLRLAGSGPLRNDLERQIREYGVADRFTLLGAIDSEEVIREMHAAHLFALTGVQSQLGKVESQGMVLLEAQSTGLPVLSSRIGGIPESVIDGQTGLLCKPGDVDGICHAIESFMNNKHLMRDFGRNGRRYVEKKFTLEIMLSRFGDLYESSINKA